MITVVVAAVAAVSAAAQQYPARAITIVQGFVPGGNADTIARVLAQEMSKGLGQTIVVEAKTGAGGNIAAAAVAQAAPDGHTLLLATGGHAVSGALYKALAYKTVEDFEWISTATIFPWSIMMTRSQRAWMSAM